MKEHYLHSTSVIYGTVFIHYGATQSFCPNLHKFKSCYTKTRTFVHKYTG